MTFKRTTISPRTSDCLKSASGWWQMSWGDFNSNKLESGFISKCNNFLRISLKTSCQPDTRGKKDMFTSWFTLKGWGVAVLQAKKPTSACAYSCILVRQAIRSTFSSPSQVTSSLLFKILLIAFQYPWMERGIVRVIKVSRRWISTKRQSNVGHAQGINYCRLHANFLRKTSIENVGSNNKSQKVSESNLERS